MDEVVLRWRDHGGRLSRTDAAYTQPAFVRCKVAHLRGTLLAGWDAVTVCGAGPVGKAVARELARTGLRIAGFVEVDPRKIGKVIHGAPVVAADDAPRLGRAFAIGAVAGIEARMRIREVVQAQGRRDGVDFVAVA